MAKKKKSSLTLIVAVVVVVVIAGLGYSIYSFYSSGSAESGIVVCDPKDPNNCLWQDHIHSLVMISVDGNVQDLPVQKGDLRGVHTHDERDVLHWHSSLPYDNVKKQIIDNSAFLVSNSLNSVGVQLPEGGKLFVKQLGGSWTFKSEYGSYAWGDKDILYIVRDNRSNDEVLAYLNSADINLPYLGAG